jgi:formate--tetrahydrofolate ligase
MSGKVLSDIEIARSVRLKPIAEVAQTRLGLKADDLVLFGSDKAKLSFDCLDRLQGRPDGRLILVTSTSPTPAGEGKTTTSIGLADALNRIGKRALVALREPSLGPCFGMKGGATGGGRSQVAPMEDINLHFTGDLHAIAAANNLLAALVDNHIHWGNALGLDPSRITWRRALDMNDRGLRNIVYARGPADDVRPQEAHFDITAASEVMAVFCLASDLADLEARLGQMIIGYRTDGAPVRVAELGAEKPMAVLLRDALRPNIVQTLEHNPALIHGGPFANIAHGCSSVIATRAALKLADYVITEAGFGADLGAEKFFDIKCRKAGLRPAAAVLVTTLRGLKMQGGRDRKDLDRPDCAAVEAGLPNLLRHIDNLGKFGVPVVVAINSHAADAAEEVEILRAACAVRGVRIFACDHWARGGAGAEELARAIAGLADGGTADFRCLYPDEATLWHKTETIARQIYGAQGISAEGAVREQFDRLEALGFGRLPVCIAKTQYSFSTDPKRLGAPDGHTIHVREVRLSAGAGLVVAVCGGILTMPGLPSRPAADNIRLDPEGRIAGLS